LSKDGGESVVMTIADALQFSENEGMDLVEISANAKPPVCRVMDYSKFLFNESKKKQAQKKKQKQVQIKEIKFRPSTGVADYGVKLRNLVKFLENGDKTKITIRFRGREMAHRELGRELLDRVVKDLKEYGKVEQYPKFEGRQMVMVLAPIKN
jgi:translation initiation factor IF-3